MDGKRMRSQRLRPASRLFGLASFAVILAVGPADVSGQPTAAVNATRDLTWQRFDGFGGLEERPAGPGPGTSLDPNACPNPLGCDPTDPAPTSTGLLDNF